MNATPLRRPALLTASGIAAALLLACGQSADPGSSGLSTESTSDALTTVNTCQSEALACGLDAGPSPTAILACQTDLQKCLMSLFPDAGALPTPPTLPGLDAGLPKLPTPPGLPSFDAGVPPLMLPDSGITDASCLASLNACLFAGTMPTTCASDAQTCLQAAATARCDAQEKECTASGAPAALCTAQRTACP